MINGKLRVLSELTIGGGAECVGQKRTRRRVLRGTRTRDDRRRIGADELMRAAEET